MINRSEEELQCVRKTAESYVVFKNAEAISGKTNLSLPMSTLLSKSEFENMDFWLWLVIMGITRSLPRTRRRRAVWYSSLCWWEEFLWAALAPMRVIDIFWKRATTTGDQFFFSGGAVGINEDKDEIMDWRCNRYCAASFLLFHTSSPRLAERSEPNRGVRFHANLAFIFFSPL